VQHVHEKEQNGSKSRNTFSYKEKAQKSTKQLQGLEQVKCDQINSDLYLIGVGKVAPAGFGQAMVY